MIPDTAPGAAQKVPTADIQKNRRYLKFGYLLFFTDFVKSPEKKGKKRLLNSFSFDKSSFLRYIYHKAI